MLPQPSASFSFLPRSTGVQATTQPTKPEDHVNEAVTKTGTTQLENISKAGKGVPEHFLPKQRQATVSTQSTPRQQTTTSHIPEETELEAIQSR
jgi:hypothetical protein